MDRKARSRLWVGLLCFFLPAVIFLTICAAMGFAPFGDSSILIFDLSDQYVEFLCALKHGDVFFSWNTALGGSYIGTFSYYVSSPFSLLSLLCPDEKMPIAVVFIIALKLACAGFTFSLLLRRRTGRYDLTTAAFALCYALMSYNMAYAMSFMWLDGVLWLPVLLIGVEDLAQGRRSWTLLFGLVVSFLSSWYISYMTGIFCVLYLLWLCGCKVYSIVSSFKLLVRLALWAGLALLLTAWLWLPTALSMLSGKLASDAGSLSFGFNWPITTLLYKLFVPGAYDSVTYTGSAFMYCSLPAVLLAAAWFFLPGIPRRTKVSTVYMGGVLLLCLWIAPLDMVWHLFQYPNSFPGRWSFAVSCFILLLGYDSLLQLLPYVKEFRFSSILPVLLASVMALDISANGLIIFQKLDLELGFESYASYHNYKEQMQPLTDYIRAEDTFLRVNSDVQRSRNEPAAFGYKGLTFFSSSYNAQVNELLNALGYAQAWFWSTSLGATPVTDALLGVGWHISDRESIYGLEPAARSGSLTLLRNPAALAPAYCSAGSELGVQRGDDPFQTQNQLMRSLSGVESDCFLPIDAQRTDSPGSAQWSFVSDGSEIYALFPKAGERAAFYINGTYHEALYTNETDCIRALGSFPAGQTVTLRLDHDGSVGQVLLYKLDSDTLNRSVRALEDNRLQVTGYGRNWLEGTVTAPADGRLLYTSIPNIPGWTVTLDGRQIAPHSFCGLILLPLHSAGSHTVSFRYAPPGLIPGLVLTGAGCAILLFLLIRKKK